MLPGPASPASRARPRSGRPPVLAGYRRTAGDRGSQTRPFGAAHLAAVLAPSRAGAASRGIEFDDVAPERGRPPQTGSATKNLVDDEPHRSSSTCPGEVNISPIIRPRPPPSTAPRFDAPPGRFAYPVTRREGRGTIKDMADPTDLLRQLTEWAERSAGGDRQVPGVRA